jgi:hypothetical protein
LDISEKMSPEGVEGSRVWKSPRWRTSTRRTRGSQSGKIANWAGKADRLRVGCLVVSSDWDCPSRNYFAARPASKGGTRAVGRVQSIGEKERGDCTNGVVRVGSWGIAACDKHPGHRAWIDSGLLPAEFAVVRSKRPKDHCFMLSGPTEHLGAPKT